MSLGVTNMFSLEFLIPIGTIAVYIVAIIIGLDCVWRVEKRIDLFLKIIVVIMIVNLARIALGMLGLSESPQWALILSATDFLKGILFASAMIVMYKIIRSRNSEKPVKR
jgi:hypothetical protein